MNSTPSLAGDRRAGRASWSASARHPRRRAACRPTARAEREAGAYRAFGFLPSGIGESCDIQRWVDGTEIPVGLEVQYRFLLSIAYTGEEELKLYLPECIVVITGANLRELRKKLARRQCTFIMQYSPNVWPEAPSRGEPVIDAIEILRPDPNAPYGRNY